MWELYEIIVKTINNFVWGKFFGCSVVALTTWTDLDSRGDTALFSPRKERVGTGPVRIADYYASVTDEVNLHQLHQCLFEQPVVAAFAKDVLIISYH